jgi:hypothetical protein
MVSPMVISKKTYTCSYTGCEALCYVDPTTQKMHKFCGAIYAAAYKAQHNVEPCSFPGCFHPRLVEVVEKVHDVCGRVHEAVKSLL